LQRFSEHTSTTLEDLRRRAEKDRHAGIAWSEGHFEPEISSAAVAVFDFAHTPLGAINVSGPSSAFSELRHDAIALALRSAGMEISRRLGWIEPARHIGGAAPMLVAARK